MRHGRRTAFGAMLATTGAAVMLLTGDPGAPQVQVDDVNPGTAIERDLCLTVAIPGGASECGDLRLAHALPAVRTLNRTRTPALLYNSQHASPRPTVAAHVTLPGGRDGLSRVVATLKVNGTPRAQGVWRGSTWPRTTGQVRIAVGYDAANDPTGPYRYTLEVKACYGSTCQATTAAGQLAVVNRRESTFGAGWWLAGLERLVMDPFGRPVFWVGGDGSTRRYTAARGDSVWGAPSLDRPDTLKRNGNGWVRLLSGNTVVRFDSLGRHIATVNRLGHATAFWYGADERLDSITVPESRPRTQRLMKPYAFVYDQDGRLERVESPGTGTSPRVTSVQRLGARVEAITDPDGARVRFGYPDGGSLRVSSRTDRRRYRTDYRYDAGFHVAGAKLWMDTLATGDSIVTNLRAGESLGLGLGDGTGALAVDLAYARIDGPRLNVRDTTAVWLDRRGAPIRIVNALGHETLLVRGDARFPARVTRMAYPVLADGRRRVESMTYDVRGNPRESTDSSNYQLNGDGSHTYATTRYEYTNPGWPDLVTRIVRPMNDSTVMDYDANGNLAWRQDGRGEATRVTFGYYASAEEPGYAPGLLKSISASPPPPEINTRTECTGTEADTCRPVVDTIYPPAATEQVEYDTLGNVHATITARGFRTTYHNDELGRLSRSESPIDGSRVRTDSTAYDALGRVIARVSRAPRMSGSTPSALERAVVRNWYDEEGNLRRVDRWADPDQADVNTIITRWERDAVGRVTAQFSPDGTPADSTDNPVERTVYDPAGNPSRVRTRRWAAARLLVPSDTLADLRMEYDALNRLTKQRVPAVRYAPRHEGLAAQRADLNTNGENPDYPRFPNDAEGGYTIRADSSLFAYDAVGNMTRADNGDAEVRRTYYVSGSLHTDTLRIRTLRPLADGSDWRRHQYGIRYNYDLNGRVIGIGHPDQLAPKPSGLLYRATRYRYEAGSGALESVTDPLGHEYRYNHGASGQIESLILPRTFQEKYSYDDDGKLALHSVVSQGGNWRATSFTYDQRGKVLRSANPVNVVDTLVAHYSGLGSVVSDTLVSIRPGGNDTRFKYLTKESFESDALANMPRKDTRQERYINGRLEGGSTRTYLNLFQKGTGRLLRADRTEQSDTTKYDAAGNVDFVEGRARSGGTFEDRASFYGMDDILRAADYRVAAGTAIAVPFRAVFEEFRYDALGRRVLTWARRTCLYIADQYERSECKQSFVRRTVWDGDRELYEIQMPANSTTPVETVENDTAVVKLALTPDYFDPNPLYGRVAYTYGNGIDRPLAITRLKYADAPYSKGWVGWDPFTIVPLWNARGEADNWFFAETGGSHCRSDDATRCVVTDFPAAWAAFHPEVRPGFPSAWQGTLPLDKRDATGTLYRRNRYYDPKSGRFTQEDPIGLAGGLNLYGFAAGDPISYSDPFGLKVCTRDPNMRRELERTFQVHIQWDASGCVSDASKTTPRRNSGAYAALQAMFDVVVQSPIVFNIKSVAWGSEIDCAGGVCDIEIARSQTEESALYDIFGGPDRRAYGTRGPQGACDRYNGQWTIGAVIVHELGHAYEGASGRNYMREAPADRWENVWHRIHGEPERCRTPDERTF